MKKSGYPRHKRGAECGYGAPIPTRGAQIVVMADQLPLEEGVLFKKRVITL